MSQTVVKLTRVQCDIVTMMGIHRIHIHIKGKFVGDARMFSAIMDRVCFL